MTELEQKIKQSEIERKRRHPLLDIVDNRGEIRSISQQTQDYMTELCPQLHRIKIWESIPTIVAKFITATISLLDREEAYKTGKSKVVLGDIMEFGISYMGTPTADKSGNLTPYINCRSEFTWEDKDLPYIDDIPIDVSKIMEEEKCSGLPIQFFEDRETIKKISLKAKVALEDCGILMMDHEWWVIALTFVAFFRKAKEFLIEHKDDGEFGVEIMFLNLISFGVEILNGLEEGDPNEYHLFVSPGRIFKMDFAKGDDVTEK